MADARYPRYRFSVGTEMAVRAVGHLRGYKLILFPSSALHFSTSLFPFLPFSLELAHDGTDAYTLFFQRSHRSRDLLIASTRVTGARFAGARVSASLSRRSTRRVVNLSRRFLPRDVFYINGAAAREQSHGTSSYN